MNILVTGASGFIGSHVVERGLQKGLNVWAAVRATSSRRYLQAPGIRFIELNLEDESRLREQLAAAKALMGGWDYVVHAAGATKCLRSDDFIYTNLRGTMLLANALRALDMVPRKFVFISSLSAFGPVREKPVAPHPCPGGEESGKTGAPLAESIYEPIAGDDSPEPDTAYGQSKWQAEEYLRRLEGFPCVVLRPTGVYGPRERDYFLMAKSIRRHVDFAVGYRRQELTFVYVKDLVEAVFLALEKGEAGRSYFVSDGRTYDSRAFSDLLQEALAVECVVHIKAPLAVLRAVCAVAEAAARLTRRPSTLNSDKYHIMKQRNWRCDIRPLVQELGYTPQYDLRRGVAEAVAWYKKEKWI